MMRRWCGRLGWGKSNLLCHLQLALILLAVSSILPFPHPHPSLLVGGLTWNELPDGPPTLYSTQTALIQLDDGAISTLLDESEGATCQRTNKNSTHEPISLIITYSGNVPNGYDGNTYLLPWPLAATRSGQQRWIKAPLIGTQPPPRSNGILLSPYGETATPGWNGQAFLFSGGSQTPDVSFFTSLWNLNVATTKWTPLGPSRMYDPNNPAGYECNDRPTIWHPGPLVIPDPPIRTVDNCYYSSVDLAQTDEFGCPWPYTRDAAGGTIVEGALYFIGGFLMSSETISDLWRLKMDSNLQLAIDQQSTSVGGVYVYNEDQLKYLANSSDPTINQERLCPVKWELLSRPLTGTAQLVNQPLDAPYPPSRIFHSVANSGPYLLISGGLATLTSNALHRSVWLLNTRILSWTELSMAPTSTGLIPSYRAFGALFAMSFSEPIGDYLEDPTDPAVIACGNRNLTVIVSGAGQDSLGGLPNDMYFGIPNCTAALPSAPFMIDRCNRTTSFRPLPDNVAYVNWSWHRIIPAMLPDSLVLVREQNWLKIGNVILSVFGQSNTKTPATTSVYDFKNKISAQLPLPFASSQLSTLTPQPTIPNPRSVHASILIDRDMYVYGGTGLSQPENELWAYQVDRYEWTLIGSSSLAMNESLLWPPFTQSATIVHSPASSRIYQYGGGFNEDTQPILDWNLPTMTCNSHLYMFDPNTNEWTNLTTLVQSITPWNNQTSAQLTGGQIIHGFLYPRARCGAQGVILGDTNSESLYIFGGILDSTGPSYSADNALWKLNLTSFEWSLIQASNTAITSDSLSHSQPTSRFYHNMLRLNSNRFLMCFGSDWKSGGVTNYGACWTYNSSNHQWELLPTTGTGPAARALTGITLVGSSTLLVYGGADRVEPYSDVFELNLNTLVWTQVFPGETNAPTTLIRSRHTMVTLDDVNQLLVYGGLDDDPLVHILHLDDQFTCGGQPSENFLPHDWFSSIEFTPNLLTFQLSPTTSAKLTPFSFQTLKGALYYIQTTANTESASITILDTNSVYSTRTTQFLSTITIDRNITVKGLPHQSSLLACDPQSTTDCSIVIDTRSVTGGGSCDVTNTRPSVIHLNGFTFRSGHSTSKGGAVWISNSVVNIKQVTFLNNEAGTFGGAVAIENSEVTFTNCSLMNNSAALVGGGIFSINSKLAIASSTFSDNSISGDLSDTSGQGGGVGVVSTTLTVSDSNFNQNSARLGGGLSSLGIPIPVDHVETSLGLRSTSLALVRNTFRENRATELGGGVYLQDVASTATNTVSLPPYLESCQFTGNTAGTNGGGIYLTGSIMICNQTEFHSNLCLNGGGGGVFWQRTDQAPTPPTFLPSLVDSDMTSLNSTDCNSTSSNLLMDSQCNGAMYGPFIASPAEALKFGTDGLDPTTVLQSIGTFISPDIHLWIVDAFNQTVTTDSNTFVSVRPIRSFSGTTTVQADSGEIRFDQLILKISPTSEVAINFTSSPLLPLLERDTSAGLLTFTLRSNSDLSSGLKSAGNHSLIQAGSCSAGCTYPLPVDLADAHLTVVQLTFDLSLFKHDYDKCSILVDTGSGSQVFKTVIGSDLVQFNAQPIPNKFNLRVFAVTNSYQVNLEIPSTKVTIALQTGDESVGYVTINYQFVTECPPGLHFSTDTCLQVVQASLITRNIIIAFASLAAVCIVVSVGFLFLYQNAPPIRTASPPFSFCILGFLLLLPIASILFSLVPSDGMDGICIARVWFGSIPIIGIVAILFAKALRVATISTSKSLSSKVISYQQMWLIVAICLAIQLAFCISFTVLPLSKSVLQLRQDGDSTDELVRECSIEAGFTTWFGIQLGYLAVLCIGAAYLSFLARNVPSQFNESSHVANALFMLILVAVILIPVGILVQDQSDAMVIIQGGGAAFISLMWTSVLFIPKFSQVRQLLHQARKQRDQKRQAELQAQATAQAMRVVKGDQGPGQHLSTIQLGPIAPPPALGIPAASDARVTPRNFYDQPVAKRAGPLTLAHHKQMENLSTILAQLHQDQPNQSPISFHIAPESNDSINDRDVDHRPEFDAPVAPPPHPSLMTHISTPTRVGRAYLTFPTNHPPHPLPSPSVSGPDIHATFSSFVPHPSPPPPHELIRPYGYITSPTAAAGADVDGIATLVGDREQDRLDQFDSIINPDEERPVPTRAPAPGHTAASVEDMRAVRNLGGISSSILY